MGYHGNFVNEDYVKLPNIPINRCNFVLLYRVEKRAVYGVGGYVFTEYVFVP